MLDMVDKDFLTVGQAAKYVGVSSQTLRRWDQEGRLKPVRRPGNNYRYYRRADLEPFRLEYRRAEADNPGELFAVAEADIEANERLREPQREAHRAVREHFESSRAPAIVQIPVGCGKTGIIATLPFGCVRGRVLVVTPNLTIRKGVSAALDIASAECFWAKTRVLSAFTEGPFAAVLDGLDANINDCIESHFVVTNIQQLASSADRWLPQFPPNFFDMILVDEGHHTAAVSWQKVFKRFPDAKVISLTATPFRSDQQPLEGEVIYKYPFARAMLNGYIKQIHSENAAPAELYFTYEGETRRHSLDEVLELREEQWFRRGVALSPECNRHIVERSIQRCNKLRAESGIKHQVIAAACSVDHARQVRAIYEECGYAAKEIHSDMPAEDQDRVLAELKESRLDCIVQVQMLGEGFDHPRLSVAAVFRPYRSLSPYIQFVGRVMRVVHQEKPEHPDNNGWIVSHVGLNNDARWYEFRELDLEDQLLIQQWLAGTDVDPESEGSAEPRSRRFDSGMLVEDELISHFITHQFLDPEDDRVLDQMLARKVAGDISLGDLIDREKLQAKLREKAVAQGQDPQSIPGSPQRRRQTARKRLSERTQSVVARILQDLELGRAGRDVARWTKSGAATNFQVVTRMVSAAVNDFLDVPSKSRQQLSSEQAEAALGELDRIGDEVRSRIEAAAGRGANDG